MRYRVYLLDQKNGIKAAETFTALDDAEALEMAAMLLRSTNDIFAAYEVWCGPRHLTGATAQLTSVHDELGKLAEDGQIRMLELEERLLSSFACIRRSRALLDTTTRLLERRSGYPLDERPEQEGDTLGRSPEYTSDLPH